MSSNERLRVALMAASVGAAVGATTSRRTGAAAGASEGVASDQTAAAAIVADPPTTSGTATGWIAGAAHVVSLMAVGALVTLIVLWGSGTFGPRVALQQATAQGSTTGAPLPQTAADLAAEITASEAAADAVAAAEPAAEDGDTAEPVAEAPRPADPYIVEIPAIGVRAPVIDLGLEPTGELEVPEDFAETGWWTGGSSPGEPGPSVIVGHVDSYLGPAVFYDLRELVYDDLIRITRDDGSAATFAVRSMVAVEKDEFPTDLVYGPTPGSQLRLITCDGDFAEGSYLGNLIVTADLLVEHPAPTTGLIS